MERNNKRVQEFYYCTRPRLAEKLASYGYEYTVKDNIYRPSAKAWQFRLTPQLAAIVHTYYQTEVGKPCPQIIIDTLNGGNGND